MWKAMILACAVGLACMGGDRAAAAPQQDPPRLPQAISTSELQRYGDMLKLSDDQRHAVEIEYERYLDEFEPLRAEMIEVAVRHARYSETEQELTASLPGFVARAQAADEGLFLNVQPLLVEAQEAALERVRSTRRRTMLT